MIHAISFPKTNFQQQILTDDDVRSMLRPRPADAHKGTMGHALLVAGSKGMAVAAILSARGCLHSGVGKLTLHTPAANNVILQTTVPEAILQLDEDEGRITALPEQTQDFRACGIGPGIGTEEDTAVALQTFLQTNRSLPMVLDADALNIIANNDGWEKLLHANTILTPHVGEFQRLIRQFVGPEERLTEVQEKGKHEDLVVKASEYAQQHSVIVVLKGHPTHICLPDGTIHPCPHGNAGMATPGSGDVLTGIITGLLTQGYPPQQAAILGVWLHALAGDAAAAELGEEYMLASDIVSHISHAYFHLKELKRFMI